MVSNLIKARLAPYAATAADEDQQKFGRQNCSQMSYFVTSDNIKCIVRVLMLTGGKAKIVEI